MSPKQEILGAFGGIADLDRLVPIEFLKRFDLAAPSQYGIVCKDVRLGIERLEALGAGPFLYAETRPPGWTERGEKKPVRVQMALGYLEDQQIELLGPGENTHLYDEKIPSDGSFALHHVGIAQLGMNRIKPAMNAAGFDTVVEIGMRLGPIYSVDVAYFDTRDELGFYLEILDFESFGLHAPLPERLVTGIGRLQRLFRAGRAGGKGD